MSHRLQEGIYFEPKQKPPQSYRLLLLDVIDAASPPSVRRALTMVITMLENLRRGEVRELEGQPAGLAAESREQFKSLHCLLGVGRRLFDSELHDPPLTLAPRPEFLSYLPHPPFPMLPWADGALPDYGQADIALQLTAEREAAVACAAVEVWKLIVDNDLPLAAKVSYSGFGRLDGRGWLEFRDGVSNVAASQRPSAIEASDDPPWMAGGTYMAFLRLEIDLHAWRQLSREQQELVIGRSKPSGSALVAIGTDAAGDPLPIAAPPLEDASTPEEAAEWRDPPQTLEPRLEASHIHRANKNRASPSAPGGFRLFRQGYDYLDGLSEARPRLGLNFVSFQSDLRIVQQVMHLPGWFGDTNFGGPKGGGPELISLASGGFYGVPPRANPFPGFTLFDE